MKIANALKQGKLRLFSSDSASLDTAVLLCSALACERSKLYSHPEQELSDKEYAAFNKLILLREQGHPVAHLIKSKEFWSMRLSVTPDTLIPRSETERLVETALNLISNEQCLSLLELGTGSGAISLAIAKERALSKITATDINEAALNVAKINADAHQIKNIMFEQANWFDIKNISTYDFIMSNPPYIRAGDPLLEQGDVVYEAKSALVSGQDGLRDLRIIIGRAGKFLNQNGWLLLEHGYQQGVAIRQLLNGHGFNSVTTIKDYSERERISLGQVDHG